MKPPIMPDSQVNIERALMFFSEDISWDGTPVDIRTTSTGQFSIGDHIITQEDIDKGIAQMRVRWPRLYNVLYLYYGYTDDRSDGRGIKSISEIARRLRTHHRVIAAELSTAMDRLLAVLSGQP